MNKTLDRYLFIISLEGSGREYLSYWISNHNGYINLKSNVDPVTLKTYATEFNTTLFSPDNYQEILEKNLSNIPDNLKIVTPWMPSKYFDIDANKYCISIPKEYGHLVALENFRKNLFAPCVFLLKRHKELVKDLDKTLLKEFLSGKRFRIDLELIFENKEITNSNRLDFIDRVFLTYNKNHFIENFGIMWHELFFGKENQIKSAAKKVVSDLNLNKNNLLIENIVSRNIQNKENLLKFNLDTTLLEYSKKL